QQQQQQQQQQPMALNQNQHQNLVRQLYMDLECRWNNVLPTYYIKKI
ncbi:MAG: hypothetical protein ACI86M_003451, partial [Saprospiraceae bacterium]